MRPAQITGPDVQDLCVQQPKCATALGMQEVKSSEDVA